MPFYTRSDLSDATVTPKYSTTQGATLNGAKPHAHPNEQVIAVMKGRMRFRLGTGDRAVDPGEVVLVPAGIDQQTTTIDDVECLNCKELAPGFSIHEGGWTMKP